VIARYWLVLSSEVIKWFKRGTSSMLAQWDDFKVILALSRGGSVAAAARELQVDNSTVSRRLSSLEDALGAQLLIRSGREFAWTALGGAALESARSMEAAVASALRAVAAGKEEVTGTVRVATVPSLLPDLVQHVLPALRATHPALTVEFGGSYQRVDLARGEADIALRFARPQEPDLVARSAIEMGWFVYAAPAYLQLAGYPSSYDELRQHRLVLYVQQMHAVAPLCWMEQYRASSQDATRVDSIGMAGTMAASGAGIAVLPTFVGERLPGIQRVFRERVGTNTGWIVYHESVRNSARVRAVAEGLLRYFARHEALYSGLPADPAPLS
jgi:DNA-binding transcriptional LysR family regulator